MATLTVDGSVNHWPPAMLEGGTITVRSATSMLYTSSLGYSVTLLGTGFTFDDDGLPSGGILTRVSVTKDATTYADFTGVSLNLARAGMLLFGYDENNGGHRGPDVFTFINLLLKFDDLMIGSNENNSFTGTHGDDTIEAGAGDDDVGGEGGNDVMDGGDGWDALWYTDANYSWESYRGLDLDAATGVVVDCWGATDTISNFEHYGDSLYSDTMKGAGVDEEFRLTRGNDVVDGRGGFDWVRYDEVDRWGAHRGVNVNLATGVARDSWKGTDTLSNIEAAEGSIFNDTLTGNAQHNAFSGGQGVDVINGGDGVDTLIFWWLGGNGIGHGVSIDLSKTVNVLDDGYGNVETATSIEDVEGSRFGDRLTGSIKQNFFWGHEGSDTLSGLAGSDDLSGGWGNDVIYGGLGNDSLGGNGDDDTVSGGSGIDEFYFGWDLADVGVDRITDFAAGSETIWVGSWWGGSWSNEALLANQFRSGAGVTSANSTTQRFIYNSTTGDLYFDADGSAAGSAAVKFATLSNLAALTYHDIHMMF